MWAASEGASLPPLLPLGVQPLQRPPRGTHGKVTEVKVVWSNVHEPLTLHLDVRPDVVYVFVKLSFYCLNTVRRGLQLISQPPFLLLRLFLHEQLLIRKLLSFGFD